LEWLQAFFDQPARLKFGANETHQQQTFLASVFFIQFRLNLVYEGLFWAKNNIFCLKFNYDGAFSVYRCQIRKILF